MDQHYNWTDPAFTARANQSMNLAVNYVAEAVHYVWASVVVTTTTQQVTTSTTEVQTTATSTTHQTNTTMTTTQQTANASTTTSIPVTDMGHVVINEAELDPPGEDADHEWLVLYNPTGTAVDIGGWRIQTTHGRSRTYAIPMSTVISSGGYWNVTFPGQFLDNEDESIILLNAQGQIVDITPALTDTQSDSNTWRRSPDGSDNWMIMPEFQWPALLALVIIASTFCLLRPQPSSWASG
jgi:hypothetical protein